MTAHPLRPPSHRPIVRDRIVRLRRVIVGLAATLALLALLVGVPYGLSRWVGWPLPHHWPTTGEVKATLTGPFTDRILLDTLACLCWLIWAMFVADTIRALPATVREAHPRTAGLGPHRPSVSARGRRSGPLRGLATVLLTAILAGLISLRPHAGDVPAGTSLGAASAARAASVATAVRVAPVGSGLTPISSPTTSTNHLAVQASGPRTVTVAAPQDGIYDSLWRIAARCLGEGDRWPEIYRLNQGLPQPDGGRLMSPSLIRPGWILHLPSPVAGPASRVPGTAPPRHGPAPPGRPPVSSTSPHRPSSTNSPAPTSSGTRGDPRSTAPAPTPSGSTDPSSRAGTGPASDAPTRAGLSSHDAGVDLGDRIYVSLGLAAAISGALVAVRRRNRRWYTPGSGRRDDLPVAPVVRSLHLAHLRAAAPPTHSGDDTDGDHGAGDRGAADDETHAQPDQINVVARRRAKPDRSAAHDHRPSAIDLPVTHGLGLAGPGAGDAARALLLDSLTTNSPDADPNFEVVIPAGDLNALAGPGASRCRVPRRLEVVADLSAALDELESAVLTATRLTEQRTADGRPRTAVVLFASVPSDSARLQAVLDNGAAAGTTAVLLGQWRAGTSVYVQADGAVSAAHGPGAPPLGAHLFTLPETATSTLLALLHDADQPHDSDRRRDATAGGQPTSTKDPGVDVADDPGLGVTGTPATTPPPELATAGNTAHPVDRRIDQPAAPLMLRVLGPVSLVWSQRLTAADYTGTSVGGGAGVPGPPHAAASVEIIDALSPRVRELLVALAVHPDGITRERLADTLWPDSPPGRPFNSLNTTLGRLRAALARATGGQLAEIVLSAGDHHRLDPALVDVDYAAFVAAALERQRATTDAERALAWRRMLAVYRGELAEGLGAEWLETPREAIRRDTVDAATGLARLVVRDDPRHALDLLEAARARDPYNEALYGDIMRVQRRLGQADTISRTLSLLTTRLAELGETPDAQTIRLAEALQRAASRPPGSRSPADTSAGTTVDSTAGGPASAAS